MKNLSMDVHEGTEILARLGILESKDESPARRKDDRFEEVNISDFSDSESPEDIVFDRDTLMPRSTRRGRGGARNRASCCQFSESSVFALIIISFAAFTTGFVQSKSPDVFAAVDSTSFPLYYVVQLIGLAMGVLCGRRLVGSLSFTSTITLALVIMAGNTAALLSSQSSSALLILFAQGIVGGLLKYAAVALVLAFWRGHRRKVLIIFVCAAAGAILAASFSSLPTGARTHQMGSRMKRAEPGRPSLPLDDGGASLPAAEEQDDGKPKKPSVAVGTADEESKTAQNEQRRKEEEEKAKAREEEEKKEQVAGGEASTTTSSTTTPTSTTTTTTSTTTTTPATTTTTTIETTTTSTEGETGNSPMGGKGRGAKKDEKGPETQWARLPLDPGTETLMHGRTDMHSVSFVLIILTILLFAVTYAASCRAGVPIDARVHRLREVEEHTPLSIGFRLRLAILQGIVGALASLCEYEHRQHADGSPAAPLMTFAVLVVMLIAGDAVLSFASLVVVVSTLPILTLLPSFGILVGSSIAHSGVATASHAALLLLPLMIDQRLSPRPLLTLDLLLLYPIMARIALPLVLLLSMPVGTASTILAIGAAFMLLPISRSMCRAERVLVNGADQVPIVMAHRPLTNEDYSALINAMDESDEEDSV